METSVSEANKAGMSEITFSFDALTCYPANQLFGTFVK